MTTGTLFLLFTRRPDAFITPQLWAEDGSILFGQAMGLGVRSLWEPYAGYYHALPRLVAWLSLPVPAAWIPTIYLWSAVVVMMAVAGHAALVFAREGGWVAGSLAGLTLVAAPHTGEVFANLTNVQWIGALGLVVLLIEEAPRGPGAIAIRLGVALLLALTGPFALFLFPMYWLGWIVKRTRYRFVLALGITACGFVTAVAMRGVVTTLPDQDSSVGTAISVVVDRTLGVFFLNTLSWTGGRIVLEFVTLATGAWLVALAWCRGTKMDIHRLVLLAATAGVLSAAVFFKFKNQIGQLGGWENGDRYFYVQRVLLLWIVLLVATKSRSRAWYRPFAMIIAAMTLLGTSRTWRAEARQDLHWEHFAPFIDRGEPVSIPIHPEGSWWYYPGRPKSSE